MQPLLPYLPRCAGAGIHFKSGWPLQGNTVLVGNVGMGCLRFSCDCKQEQGCGRISCLSRQWSWRIKMLRKTRRRRPIICCLIIRKLLWSIGEDAQGDQRQPYWGEGSHLKLSSDHTWSHTSFTTKPKPSMGRHNASVTPPPHSFSICLQSKTGRNVRNFYASLQCLLVKLSQVVKNSGQDLMTWGKCVSQGWKFLWQCCLNLFSSEQELEVKTETCRRT